MTEPSREKLRELYLPPSAAFTLVDVPELAYFAIDGRGDPGGAEFRSAVAWLFGVIRPFRRVARERMGRNFVEPPLEALFWSDDMCDLAAGRRERISWRVLVSAPDWISDDELRAAAADLEATRGAAPSSLRRWTHEEGRCAQILCVGPYEELAAGVAARLHGEFLPAEGLTARDAHHEIYLDDPSRTPPPKRRTVVRQPVT
ncbi:MAG: GyrI-like domain-containing protein [Planctomycetota bacterium]